MFFRTLACQAGHLRVATSFAWIIGYYICWVKWFEGWVSTSYLVCFPKEFSTNEGLQLSIICMQHEFLMKHNSSNNNYALYQTINWALSVFRKMSGKVFIVTGANAGIGFEITRTLCEAGHDVVMACRSEEKTTKAIEKIKKKLPNALVTFMNVRPKDVSNCSGKLACHLTQTA